MIVTLCGQKGGSGKSTLAGFLACELVRRGRRVLAVDTDPQRTLLTFQAVGNVPGLEVRAMRGDTLHAPGNLDAAARGFDDVVVDTAGREDVSQRSAIAVADVALLPCGPSAAEAWSLVSTVVSIRELLQTVPHVRAAFVINRQRPRSALGKLARGVLAGTGLPVLAAELNERQAYMDAFASGACLATYAPRDRATEEFDAFVNEVVRLGRGRKRG